MQDRENQEELKRLIIQDQMITRGMGEILSEQPDPSALRHVLDVGCGTGSWLIEVAKANPNIEVLIGVDASRKMITYAREQAAAQEVSDRVEFHLMDALLMLEFPTAYFDLVNHRCAASFLRQWEWPRLLDEYQRVSRPGGIVRVTEFEPIVESSSPALTRLAQLLVQALYQAGHFFLPEKDGITSQPPRLLRQYGLKDVQTHLSRLRYSIGTPPGQDVVQDIRIFFRNIVPFLRKWTQVPDDYEAIYQQMLGEIQQPGFVIPWDLLTAWAINPPRNGASRSSLN